LFYVGALFNLIATFIVMCRLAKAEELASVQRIKT